MGDIRVLLGLENHVMVLLTHSLAFALLRKRGFPDAVLKPLEGAFDKSKEAAERLIGKARARALELL